MTFCYVIGILIAFGYFSKKNGILDTIDLVEVVIPSVLWLPIFCYWLGAKIWTANPDE